LLLIIPKGVTNDAMAPAGFGKLDGLKAQATKWEDAQKPVPEGVYPVFLGPTSQEKYGSRPREEVTEDKPYVMVTKAFFLEDIQFRGAISDFHPMKALIEKYPEDSLMLMWDHEEWYGQNHFLVHDVKVKDAVLADCKPPEAEAAGGGAEGGGDGGGGGEDEAVEAVKAPPPESPAEKAKKAAAAAAKAAAAAQAKKVAAMRAEVSTAERVATTKRITAACAELETWLKTADDQVNLKMAPQDLQAHHEKTHQDMLLYLATEAAKGVKVQPHHIEGRVYQQFGIDMTDQLATMESRALYPIEEPIIEPLIELCRVQKGMDVEPEDVEKLITDLRTEEVEGRTGSPSFDFVNQALMAKTASPRDVVALARLMEKMVSSGGAVMILDDILELPNGPEAEKVASLPADRPRNHWVTPTLAVMPLSRSRFQRSIVVDYSSVLVKGF